MTLIIEDGTGVEFANGYLSLADARELALKIGVTLPADDTEAKAALISGGLYLQMYEQDICGSRTTDTQGLMFPRMYTSLRGVTISSDAIPNDLKSAQLLAAEDFANGGSAWGTQDDGLRVASHSVGKGAVAQSYFNNGKSGNSYKIPRVDLAMSGFCGLDKSGGSIKLPRV